MELAWLSAITERFQGEAITPTLQDNTLLFFLLTLFLLLLGLIRILDPDYFNDLFRSILDGNYIQLMGREGKLNWNIVNIFLDFVFLGSMAFFLFQIGRPLLQMLPFWQLFLLVLLGNLAHLALNWLLGILFYGYSDSVFLINRILIFNRFIGFIFLPLVFIVTYISGLPDYLPLYIVGFLLIMILSYRVLTTMFQVKSTANHGIIYNFFYLCITEIAPLIIVIELVTKAF